ncbi:hypothetical protein QJQ45_029305 [Haematococcus lacustris]|nr:hypothetical protein QJQ45_029305 [Haematococcus lacustris]
MVRSARLEYTITPEDEALARLYRLRPARRGPTVAPTPEAVAAREAADAARLVSPRDAAIAKLPANIDPASPAATELINFLEEQSWPEAHTEYPVYLHGRSVTEHEAMLEASLQRMVARNAAAPPVDEEEDQEDGEVDEEEPDERDVTIDQLQSALRAREDTLTAVRAQLTALEASHGAVGAGVSRAGIPGLPAPALSPQPSRLPAMHYRNTVASLFDSGRLARHAPADAAAPQSAGLQEAGPQPAGVTLQEYITDFRNTITLCGTGCMNRALTVATFQRGLTPQLRGAVAKDLRSLLSGLRSLLSLLAVPAAPAALVALGLLVLTLLRLRLRKPEQEELKKQIKDYLAKGMIEPSSSPYAAPILFVQKKSGELRMCIDYRQLNKLTLRDQYPLPRIDDLFDRLSGCSVFSSLDLQAGYHQIRITPEDVPKTAFRTPEGHFQFKVLSFGLTNAPATFQRVMNDAFAPVLGKCALVYLDDILVMSKSLPDHMQHLRLVFDLLRANKLFAKMSKCEFMQLTLKFLGHVITAGAISVDPDKVRAIADWPLPSSLTQLQSFLGAANFVRKFVQGFSAISAPLTDLCGKLSATFPWHSWPDHERLAFHELKSAVANVPMLRLPDHTQPFQVYCDASLQGVGAVLMQDGYPLAYLSKKLSSAEVNYTTADLSSMYQDTHGLWRLTGKDKVVVPNDSELRNHILHEMHDAVYSGHVGINKTLERVSRVFWWNTMRDDVRYYVSTCDACQRDKASSLKPGGLLNPLSIPDYRWESVSMDFITKLPSGSHGYDAICVFVDRLSKMVHFVPCREDLKARRFAQLFIDNVYKLHGMLAELISDRGSLFTSVFWREVMRRCGSKPALSSSYHPQSDGQTERYNRVLEEMLRHYISPTQSDWPDYLALAEFAVNNSWQESIQSTPFLVNTGQSPMTIGLRDLPYGGRCPSAHAFTRWWQDAVANARKCMAAAQSRQAAYANKARRDVEYKVGQKVLLSTKNLKLKPGKARKLIPRYVGPFEILLLVGAVAVKLDLPASMSRLHPVFHVSLIKPYTGTDVGFMPPPVTWMDETPVYYVERLLDHKGVKDNKAGFYLVQWEGYDSTHNTWEPRSNLTGCDKVLAEYNAIHHLT